MFYDCEVIPLFVVLIRTVVLYLLIILGLRLLGKRQIGELEPAELTLALIIADLASVPMQDNGIPLLAGLIPIIVLLCISTILSVLSAKSIRFRALLCGRPSIVVENGVVLEKELRKNRLTVDELMEELRMQGCPLIQSVKFAVLETNGQLSVIPYASQQPVAAAQMGIEAEEPGLPVILISDGRVLTNNLKVRGYEQGWLQKQLNTHGLKSPQQAFLLTVDQLGNTYCVPKGGRS
jgi:uncharacterized membrane protein YcaP (DUF421 family)